MGRRRGDVWGESDEALAFAEQPLGGEEGEEDAEPPPAGPDEGLFDGGLLAVDALEEGGKIGGLGFAQELAACCLGEALQQGSIEGELGKLLILPVGGAEIETEVTAGRGGAFTDGEFEVAGLEGRGEATVDTRVIGVGGEFEGGEGFAIAHEVCLGGGVGDDGSSRAAEADADFGLITDTVAEAIGADGEAGSLDLKRRGSNPGGDLHPEALVI